MDDGAVELSLRMTADDYRALQLEVRRTTLLSVRRATRAASILGGFAVGLALGFGGLALAWLSVLLVGVCLVGWGMVRLVGQVRALALDGAADVHLRADAAGIVFTGLGTVTHVEWWAVSTTTDPARIFVRLTPLTGWVIPRSRFRSKDDERRFLELASQAVPRV